MRALRKVYKSSGKTKGGGSYSARWAPPGATAPPSGDVVALESLDLDIIAGEFFGLLGPNGAGKTTAIGILTTRVLPTSGTAVVAGADVVTESVRVRQTIGVVPQRPNADLSLNVLENLQFHAAYFGISSDVATKRAYELLERLGLSERANSKLTELSGGQQQRLMIVRALMHEPDIIFLDEPTVGLDPQARLGLWEILRDMHERGRAVAGDVDDADTAARQTRIDPEDADGCRNTSHSPTLGAVGRRPSQARPPAWRVTRLPRARPGPRGSGRSC